MKKTILLLIGLTTLYSNTYDDFIQELNVDLRTHMTEQTKIKNPYKSLPIVSSVKSNTFIELAIGFTSLSLSDNITNTFLRKGASDTSSTLIDLSIGHHFDKNFFSTINYQVSGYDLSSISNTSFTINYENQEFQLKPYIGLIIGYSYLTWDENPISNFTIKVPSSESFIYGVQVGGEIVIDKDFSFIGKLQHLRFNHETIIKNEKLKMDSQNIAIIGVRFKF